MPHQHLDIHPVGTVEVVSLEEEVGTLDEMGLLGIGSASR